MGGVILFGLFVLAIYALIRPVLLARAKAHREDQRRDAHEEVVRRLDDHRSPRKDGDRDGDSGS